MDYRDERDALRGRIDNLEQDLATANRELEERRRAQDPARLAELERELAETRRRLDQVGSELDRAKGKGSGARPALFVVVGVAVAVIAAGAGSFLLLARSPPPPPPPIVEQPPAQVEPREAPKPKPAPAPAPAPAAPKRVASATWKASVTRATGLSLAPGTACAIEAALEGDGRGISARDLTVTCGGKPLYRSSDALEGMSMYSSGAEEKAGAKAGTQVYTLAYHDKGTRTGARSEVSLDTASKSGAVWRDSAPSWRVELSITPESAPAQGDRLGF